MLLSFTTRNFRSFKNEESLSLIASKDKHLIDGNTSTTGLKNIPRVINSAAIYGANASGKTNFIKAIQYFSMLVAQSSNTELDAKYLAQPFLIDKRSATEPILFEISFLIDGVRHQYGVELTRDRVIAEWLLVYENPKPQEWFSREYDDTRDAYSYKFSSYFRGEKATWEAATRNNTLFLATAVNLNSTQLKPVFEAITKDIVIFMGGENTAVDLNNDRLSDDNFLNKLKYLLLSADTGISNIGYIEKESTQTEIKFDRVTGKTQTSVHKGKIKVPTFTHKSSEGEHTFEIPDESDGTQRLFNLASPLFDILALGKVLVIDELDRSLHPLIVREIIDLFHNKDTNKHGAQLIFTIHDTTILTDKIMRRDQVWFVEKNSDQCSIIYPLSDYRPRKHEAISKKYLSGQYGAVPISEKLIGSS